MSNLLSKFNLVSIVSGILISLLLTLILKTIIGDTAFYLMPVFSGLISIFLANETELVPIVLTSLVAGLITIIWVGPLFIILALTGGCLGAVLNGYLSNGKPDLYRTISDNNSRVKSIEDWITHPQTNKLIPLILTLVLAIILIWGVGLPGSEPTTETPKNMTNNTSQISQEQVLKNNVTAGVELFFKDFNALFSQDGINNGYILSTLDIVTLKKVSNTEVIVTANLERISSTGEKFNSTWQGPFYLENGTWVDKGEFIQINSFTIKST